MGKRVLHWFRKGLRLHDNPALLDSCQDAEVLFPVFVIDPWFVGPDRVGRNRYRFLLQSLQDLDKSLQRMNSRLFVIRGKPQEVLVEYLKKWEIDTLSYEIDTEPYAIERDNKIRKHCESNNIQVISRSSHTLFDLDKLLSKFSGRKAPTSYSSFTSMVSKVGPPPKPVDTPDPSQIPNASKCEVDSKEDFSIPTLQEMGYEGAKKGEKVPHPGGETEGLRRLQHHMQRTDWVAEFRKPKTKPNSLEPDTTALSPYLKFGCLSARTFYWELQEVYGKVKSHTKPPESLEGQLLWREFFYLNGYCYKNFDRMAGNPVSRQMPWKNNPKYIQAWENARTGYPFIDACMTQLREEGWLHHLARHAVACFLTRGDLYCSWEVGAKIFDILLIDSDWSINNGNWMWLSASAYFSAYYRVYSPVAFGKKTDPKGEYIKKWLPVLKDMPSQYIYEPWKAPESVQKKANCIVGKDYPKRIVIHEEVKEENMEKMKHAYAANRENNFDFSVESGVGATQVGSTSASHSDLNHIDLCKKEGGNSNTEGSYKRQRVE